MGGPDHQGTCSATWTKTEGELRSAQFFCGDCFQGGEEDRRLQRPWLVLLEDPREAGHEGGSEELFRQGVQGGREARQDYRQGVPGSSSEEADLDRLVWGKWPTADLSRGWLTWESREASLDGC